MRRNSDEQTHHEAPLTPAEREAALQYLKDLKLTERIVEDFRRCGLVGERATVLTAYLAAVSRKLTEPLAVLIVARWRGQERVAGRALCESVQEVSWKNLDLSASQIHPVVMNDGSILMEAKFKYVQMGRWSEPPPANGSRMVAVNIRLESDRMVR